MRQFKDSEGRPWDVVVNMATHNRVQDLAGVNLSDLLEEKAGGLLALCKDLRKFFDVLWVLCARQAEERKIEQEAWAGAMGGDVVVEAQRAFMEALADFFPRLKREALHKAIAVGTAATARNQEQALAKIEALSVAELAGRLIGWHGGAPASSGSIPVPSL